MSLVSSDGPANATVLVWDWPLRVFHWSLVLAVAGSFATHYAGMEWFDWHRRCGYAIAVLVGFRLAWGFVGPRYSRFASFLRGPGAYLLAEFSGGTAPGSRSSAGRLERAAGRSWSSLVLDYLDLLQAVKRSEVIDFARQSVEVVGHLQTEVELRARYDEGRLFRFHPGGEIVKLARKITVVFADLRGFTAASERGISERELAQKLYQVFDPFASLVERYHRRIDKFTGDGAMITFGFSRVTPHDELNALRTALAIQEIMADLRTSGRTQFSMGISVHTGRAQVAHFILDDRTMDRTVIGRNVNIAGRLSSSGKVQGSAVGAEAWEETAQAPLDGDRARRDVWIDETGILFNTGIVVSQDTVEEIVSQGIAEPWTRSGIRGYRILDAYVLCFLGCCLALILGLLSHPDSLHRRTGAARCLW